MPAYDSGFKIAARTSGRRLADIAISSVDEYLGEHGLRRHELFRRVLQSLIELSKAGSEERSLLESLSNHIGAKGAKKKEHQPSLPEMADDTEEAE